MGRGEGNGRGTVTAPDLEHHVAPGKLSSIELSSIEKVCRQVVGQQRTAAWPDPAPAGMEGADGPMRRRDLDGTHGLSLPH
jgi:hypothetical protein